MSLYYVQLKILNILTSIMASFLRQVTLQTNNFLKDELYLNSFGTRKLLNIIGAIIKVTFVGTYSKTLGPIKGFTCVWRSGFPMKGSKYHNEPKYCHICSVS